MSGVTYFTKNAGDGQTGIASSEYARKRRELMALARDLRAMGASDELEIPRIAVIGAQSAGKSSLVEAVTGIKVPRDSGTCTRCPMECTILTPSDADSHHEWSCTISLHIEKEAQEAFSPVLTSKGEVEVWIRRAQAAVLCPYLARDTFKTKGREEVKDLSDSSKTPRVLKFTKSVVVIDIIDPEGADLSFVDLPGLIQNEDKSVMNLVTELVQDYITRTSTIILVAVPASDDLENQLAMKLAIEADPKGERTIGVVTKPDTLTSGASGARKKWQSISEGGDERHRLLHGYYCVRLPDDDERNRNITRREAEQTAMQYHKHFAMALLMNVLDEALPKLKKGVSELLALCLADQGKLQPEPVTGEATMEVIKLIEEFCRDVKDVVYGRSVDKTFVHRSQEAYHSLLVQIRLTAPDFRPFEDPENYRKPEDPSGQIQEDAALVSDEDLLLGESSEEGSSGIDEEEVQVMGLLDVNDVIRSSTGWELPHNIPYEAKTRLIQDFVRLWSTPAKDCFTRIESLLREIINDRVSVHFGRFPLLQQYLTPYVQAKIDESVGVAMSALEDALKRENMPYGTQNRYYLETARERWLSHYKSVQDRKHKYLHAQHLASGLAPVIDRPSEAPRYKKNASQLDHESAALASLRALGYQNVTVADFSRLHPAGDYQFAEELVVMAEVRSYFQVAYKRVIDIIPMTIQHDLTQGVANHIHGYLLLKLEIGKPETSQRLQTLLSEDPMVAEIRSRLKEERQRLENMKTRLDAFSI